MRKANPAIYALTGALIGTLVNLVRVGIVDPTPRIVGTYIGGAIVGALVGWGAALLKNRT